MHIGRIEGTTNVLGAPKGWDTKANGLCGNLPVRVEQTSAGIGMTSAWFPTPEEIDAIVAGAPVYLTVIGTMHPPVCMAVGPKPNND